MYKEAREYLNEITKYGSVLGLGNIKELLARVGNPDKELQFVHIAGTNGKGSTLAFISTILKTAGYKIGRYISPSVFSYREKIQVDEQYITKTSLGTLTFIIKAAIDRMLMEGFDHPTVFEVETVLALLYFKQEKCDLVVLETGLGGLLDATNVVEKTLVAVLTPISKDHMEYLGDSLQEIAANKSGIIKKESIIVTANQEPDAMKEIRKKCFAYKNELILADFDQTDKIAFGLLSTCFDYNELKKIEISLLGSYQIQNAILAIETVKALRKKGFLIEDKAIRMGLKLTKWPGRFSEICETPLIILDGAHNEAAAKRLKETIDIYLKQKRIMFVIGVLSDKEYEKIVKITAPIAVKILTVTTPNNKRALDGKELAKVVKKYNTNVYYMPTLEAAAIECMKQKNQMDAIIVFGSLSYLGEFERYVNSLKGGNGYDG
ncbi:dihydrofolate synthase/folylpolyglutamate synthase [Lachnotalea glycerini]|uniref:tetrahydrofolate synthase n=1 Tax=Lachnotalea glycerini TaxID=1763509 RepID=A0A318EUM8_9FIRM|nr:folylpolyglutamate synthase/dihydrofolate synthase family protein [Lachnotalea glycerini]PXV95972.1 dihydrofolate synthase/folylpolyglutamate synthase [Lachnotalea glycerini]